MLFPLAPEMTLAIKSEVCNFQTAIREPRDVHLLCSENKLGSAQSAVAHLASQRKSFERRLG